jgi:hypothetical protein
VKQVRIVVFLKLFHLDTKNTPCARARRALTHTLFHSLTHPPFRCFLPAPANVDWGKTVAALRDMIFKASVAAPSEGTGDSCSVERRIVLVDHYLLFASPELLSMIDRVLFLSPWGGMALQPPFPTLGSAADLAARDVCVDRRVSRNPDRASEEKDNLRRYYESAVWPAFHTFTVAPVQAALTGVKGRRMCAVP